MEFVYEIENNIPDEMCDEIIKRFEDDNRKRNGIVGSGYEPHIKLSKDLHIDSYEEEWSDIRDYLNKKLSESILQYIKYLNSEICTEYSNTLSSSTNILYDSGYNIQRTEKGGFYTWHTDASKDRKITFLWYLNTLDPNVDGGATEFYNGKKITPQKGKLIFFPAAWTHIHRGTPVISDNIKYICTGWLT